LTITTNETTVSPDVKQLLIGTYTDVPAPSGARGVGIVGCGVSREGFGPPKVFASPRNPSYLALSPGSRFLYAVSETDEGEHGPGGTVTAFARDRFGDLTVVNSCSSGGNGPCHISLSPSKDFLLAANYGAGTVAAIAVGPGGVGPVADVVSHRHLEANADRVSHPHMIAFDPVTEEVLVPDLGLDVVLTYQLTERGHLIEKPSARLELAPRSGPRHLVFHPNGRDLFIINETANTLVALRRTPHGFVATDTASTLQDVSKSSSWASAVRVSATGQYVFVANRASSDGSIAVFSFEEDVGRLNQVVVASSGGSWPRDFVLVPESEQLVVANQDSDNLVLLEFDRQTKELRQTATAALGSPACLLFV
jgi:6-phosphogluconolactonase